ncbi:hypothetical protein OS188_07985 [Xanthomarina sp. F1114]|uniref:hypothetical protein n=1 Tax=Xanthomarina sp. F1114 TaxID=2996019 RepID=UPI00225DDFCD|nr:hypothetical protein [Xanthomarina sp. F1114]MCX7547890.1 hypothetical protein [Xanthomarina sp. F1114]
MIFLFLISSCATTKEQTNEKEVPARIVFLTYHIKKNTKKESDITFLNHKLVDGKIKGYSNNEKNLSEGDLECAFLDKDRKVLQVVKVENPLRKVVEYVNDSNHLEKRIIELDSTQFVIRAPYMENTKYLEISEISSDKTPRKLLTTKL